jgi:lysophospholipid acyltransferase (LPLAT)-like uncharacterized protein
MPLLKAITRASATQAVICWLAALYIRFVNWTGRWRVVGNELPESWAEEGKSFIVAFWHGRLLMMSGSWRYPERVHVLISAHRDGQLISRTIAHFGSKTVVGSRRRGGASAALEIRRLLAKGAVVAVTPDGPRGPRMRASDGVITLAMMAEVPILPLTYACRPRKVLSSWDRFTLPLPFCKGVFLWGEPLTIARHASAEEKEAKRAQLETVLQDITREADAMLGLGPIAPAPPAEAETPAKEGGKDGEKGGRAA